MSTNMKLERNKPFNNIDRAHVSNYAHRFIEKTLTSVASILQVEHPWQVKKFSNKNLI